MTDGQTKLLSGGNPQIPKGYGNKPVQNYIEAMPDWKREIGRKLDKLIEAAVPDVQKGVKWNSPFYGMKKDVWFLSFHCFTKYVKVTFLEGAKLDPMPPESSKHEKIRYLNIYKNEAFDEAQFTDWVVQASKLDGERM